MKNSKSKKIHHPGYFLKISLQQFGITQKQFAYIIGKKESEVSYIINGKLAVSAQRAFLIGTAFDNDPQTWLNLQRKYDIYLIEKKFGLKKTQSIKDRSKELKLAYI